MEDSGLGLCLVKPAVNVLLENNWEIWVGGRKGYDLVVEIASFFPVVSCPLLFLEIELPASQLQSDNTTRN